VSCLPVSTRNCLAALAIIVCFTVPTVALACRAPPPEAQRLMALAQAQRGLAEIDNRLPTAALTDADLAKVKDLLARARKSAAAGNPKTANARIAEIMKILGVPYVVVSGLPAKCG
jgi:hypothetical protein